MNFLPGGGWATSQSLSWSFNSGMLTNGKRRTNIDFGFLEAGRLYKSPIWRWFQSWVEHNVTETISQRRGIQHRFVPRRLFTLSHGQVKIGKHFWLMRGDLSFIFRLFCSSAHTDELRKQNLANRLAKVQGEEDTSGLKLSNEFESICLLFL